MSPHGETDPLGLCDMQRHDVGPWFIVWPSKVWEEVESFLGDGDTLTLGGFERLGGVGERNGERRGNGEDAGAVTMRGEVDVDDLTEIGIEHRNEVLRKKVVLIRGKEVLRKDRMEDVPEGVRRGSRGSQSGRT